MSPREVYDMLRECGFRDRSATHITSLYRNRPDWVWFRHYVALYLRRR